MSDDEFEALKQRLAEAETEYVQLGREISRLQLEVYTETKRREAQHGKSQ